MTRLAVALAAALVAWNPPEQPTRAVAPAPLQSPAPPGSLAPALTRTADGAAVLSWLEPAPDDRHRFRYAVRPAGGAWGAPITIAEEPRMFANWADTPAVYVLRDGTWAAHWLSRTGPGTAYDIRTTFSKDGGRTWSPAVIPHRDGTKTEHGFVSMQDAPDGGLMMVWLDGRAFAQHGGGHHGPGGQTALRSTIFRAGVPGDEIVIDPRVCDCCPTSMTRTERGLLAAYRGRSADEIRDILLARFDGGRWQRPIRVHADNWQIPGCPVNGPALASRGSRVALAWFTAEGDDGRVQVAFSEDAGASFGPPARVDDGVALGRVGASMLDDGTVLVLWLERVNGKAEVRVRRLGPGNQRGEGVRIATVANDRSSGHPRMVAAGHELVFAWTDGGVKTAVAPLPR